MRVGLFFGSFNPIHHGHLIIGDHVFKSGMIDQLWFVVSPQNPFKEKGDLTNEYVRLNLVKLGIEGVPYFRVSDVEFKLPRPSYTIDTLVQLEKLYPETEFIMVVGSDSYENIVRWKSGEQILSKYKILIYNRVGSILNKLWDKSTLLYDSPIIEISSTNIRKMIKNKESIKYYVPENVRIEIEMSSLYKK